MCIILIHELSVLEIVDMNDLGPLQRRGAPGLHEPDEDRGGRLEPLRDSVPRLRQPRVLGDGGAAHDPRGLPRLPHPGQTQAQNQS